MRHIESGLKKLVEGILMIVEGELEGDSLVPTQDVVEMYYHIEAFAKHRGFAIEGNDLKDTIPKA